MKDLIVFCVNDSRLIVYTCSTSKVDVLDTFDFCDNASRTRFSEQADLYKKRPSLLLLDLSCEDYHQETLPHVFGRDRKLLISRKLIKYFSTEEYAFASTVKRLKVGRRDDIYSMSGIADTSAIDPAIDLIAENNIEISGVYSLPLLTEQLIHPLVYNKQVLFVSCDAEQGGRYTVRQTFIDDGHLYFSRQTTVLAGEADKIADQFNKEIERTWQYLNNKRVLTAGERLQVLMAPSQDLMPLLKSKVGASRCDYLYVDATKLCEQHGCHLVSSGPILSALSAFLLAKKSYVKPHYKPVKLAYFRKHQKINRLLARASVAILVVTFFSITFNIKILQDINKSGNILAIKATQARDELKLHVDLFDYEGPSPQKMQSLVSLYQNISLPDALPNNIFTVISANFSDFNDLILSDIEWHIVTQGGAGLSRQDSAMSEQVDTLGMDEMLMSGMDGGQSSGVSSRPSGNRVVVNLKGTIRSFDGDYRYAIERVELLAKQLRAQTYIEAAVATKLPLDIDPSIRASGSLSSKKIPSFVVEVTLKTRVL